MAILYQVVHTQMVHQSPSYYPISGSSPSGFRCLLQMVHQSPSSSRSSPSYHIILYQVVNHPLHQVSSPSHLSSSSSSAPSTSSGSSPYSFIMGYNNYMIEKISMIDLFSNNSHPSSHPWSVALQHVSASAGLNRLIFYILF